MRSPTRSSDEDNGRPATVPGAGRKSNGDAEDRLGRGSPFAGGAGLVRERPAPAK